jgi:signal transduction histidine kinase
VLLLFPDGRLPSRRWRAVAAAAVVIVAVNFLLLALRSGPLHDEAFDHEISWRGALPASTADATTAALDTTGGLGVLLLVTIVIGLLFRYAHSNADERQRLKPLSLVAAAAAGSLLVQLLPGLHTLGVTALVVSVSVGFPTAIAVGILRYRLWELDHVVVGAIVYGALTVIVTGLYVGIVVVLGAWAHTGSDAPELLPTVLATAVIAVVVTPLKDRLGRAARRLVYGVRATPYEALTVLPRQLAAAPAVDEVLPRAAEALTLGLGVPSARVRALIPQPGGEPEAARVAWSPAPPDGEEPELVAVPVRHLGTVVGDVAVQPWPDRPLSAADHRLLADLADQAGPALRGVALTSELQDRLDQITRQSEELRASRARIATAQLDERRRLERDIHDGAQQQLVAMAMMLKEAEELLAKDDGAKAVLERVRQSRADAIACIDELRELSRGIYPPVLAARGLPAALRGRARTSARIQVTSSADVDSRRFGAEVESATYFACLEAIQNATKHAPDAEIRIALSMSENGDELCFEVSDDGPGFDPTVAAGQGGIGLLGMADRVGAVGGDLTISSEPGRGTTVRGRVPAPPL